MEDLKLQPKTCSTCKRLLPAESFSMNNGKRRSNCKECARTSKAVWYQRNKGIVGARLGEHRKKTRAFMNDAKDKPCLDCGQSFHHSLMDFDHRDETLKLGSVAEMVANGKGLVAIAEEISKCDLVCCFCHRIRTWNRLHIDQITLGSDASGLAPRL